MPTSLVSCSRSSADLLSAHGAGGDARHERGDEPVAAQGRRGEVGEHRQDQDGQPFPGDAAPARPPRGHEQACSAGSDHHAHRHADGELDQRVDQRCLAPGRATAGHGAGQEEQHERSRQTVVEAAFDVDDPAQPARYALVHDHGRGQRRIGGGQRRREQRDNPDAQPREQPVAGGESGGDGQREPEGEHPQRQPSSAAQPPCGDLGGVGEQQDRKRQLDEYPHRLGVELDHHDVGGGQDRAHGDQDDRQGDAVAGQPPRYQAPRQDDRKQRREGCHGYLPTPDGRQR